MFRCLYCDKDKPDNESTLEHAIPQFLGGAHSPLHYKLRNVCGGCNGRLGLHVDASYARSWTVTNGLAIAARKLYAGPGGTPLPLTYIGLLPNIPGLKVSEEMVAELWLGPSGETIVWVRVHNDAMYWYSGGHPIAKKNTPSTLYYFPTSSDKSRFDMGLEAFNDAFKKAKARKVLGAQVIGLPAGTPAPGFDLPTLEEAANIEAIRAANVGGHYHAKAAFNLRFDDRFIGKMVLGVGCSLFGAPYLNCKTAKESRLRLWPEADQPSNLRSAATFETVEDQRVSQMTGYPGAVSITVMRAGEDYTMSMNIDQRMPFTTELAPGALTSALVPEGDAYVLLLFPQLRNSIELNLSSLIGHSTGVMSHPDLERVDAAIKQSSRFDANLSSLQGPPQSPASPSRPPMPS